MHIRGRYAAGRDINIRQEAPPALEALHQLPPDVAEFTNREAELAELRDAFERTAADGSAVVISALAGKPGVGKSSLAIHLAHRLAPRFPEAQLYVNLRGTEREQLDPGEVLAGFLHALGIDAALVPASLEQRASVYRAQLAHKRAIIVLDNAGDERQVRPLLPGGRSCAVLVTSRSPLGGLEGSRLQFLDVIDRAAAVVLLGKLAGEHRVASEPEAADAVARLCGDLPLALRIAGALLAEKPAWSVARLAERLSDEHARLTELQVGDREVRGSFELSYQRLAHDDARLFRRLGTFTGPNFPLGLAAAIDDTKVNEAERALERLADAQLLEALGENRYRFHDLLRLFARERLEAEDAPGTDANVAARAHRFYLCEAETAAAQLRPQPEPLGTAVPKDADRDVMFVDSLSWFELERANLVACVDQAYAARQWTTAERLAINLADFFELRGHWDDWQHTHELAVEAARHADDPLSHAKLLTDLGRVYAYQGRWAEAIVNYEHSLTIRRALSDRHGEAETMTYLGRVYDDQGRRADAITSYDASLGIRRDLRDRHGEGETLTWLGRVYERQGRYDDAIACHEQSLSIMREVGNRHGEAWTLINLGSVHTQRGNLADAVANLEQSITTHRQLGDRRGEAEAVSCLAVVHVYRMRPADAVACYEQSLTTYRKLGDPLGEGSILSALGQVYAREARWAEATDTLERARVMLRDLGDRRGEAEALNALGVVDVEEKRWADGLAKIEQSLSTRRELGDRLGEAYALATFANAYETQRRWADAVNCHEQSLAIYRELGDRVGEAWQLDCLGDAYAVQGRRKDAIAAYKQSLTIYRRLGAPTAADVAKALAEFRAGERAWRVATAVLVLCISILLLAGLPWLALYVAVWWLACWLVMRKFRARKAALGLSIFGYGVMAASVTVLLLHGRWWIALGTVAAMFGVRLLEIPIRRD